MPKGLIRTAGLTPASVDTSFPDELMETMRFLDGLHDRTDPDAVVSISDLVVTVPAGLLLDLPGGLVIYGDPTDSDNFKCYTGAALSGTAYTPIASQSASLSAGQVRVRKGTGRLDFPSGTAGTDLYLTIRAQMGGVPASLLQRLWGELRAMQSLMIQSFTAGQAWDNQAVYFGGDGKTYVTDVADFDKQAWGWGMGSGSANDTIYVLREGPITPGGSYPINTPLWIGQDGTITWEGDSSGNELVSGDYVKPCGVSFDGSTVQLFLKGPVTRQYS